METINYIADTDLGPAAKSFLFELVGMGIEIEIYESQSEIIFSRGFIWVEETLSDLYYSGMLESIERRGIKKVALVRQRLIKDLSWKDDADQIREEMREENSQVFEESTDK